MYYIINIVMRAMRSLHLPRGYVDGIARLAQIERHALALIAGDRDHGVAVRLRGGDRRADRDRDGQGGGDQRDGRLLRRRAAAATAVRQRRRRRRRRHGGYEGRYKM